MHTHKHINTLYEFGLSLPHIYIHVCTAKKTIVFLGKIDTKHIFACITAFSVCTLNQVNLRSPVLWVKWSQPSRGMLWEALEKTSKHLVSSSSAACLCLVSVTSPAKSLCWTSMLNMNKQEGR